MLEKIPFLWSKFSFIYKVTFRNIFRYKKRILMTVIGIAGCTALMLTGFGLRHAISSIVPKQFEEIFRFLWCHCAPIPELTDRKKGSKVERKGAKENGNKEKNRNSAAAV